MTYLLGLYRDVNNALHAINRSNNEDILKNLRRIIGKLKAINTLGHAISWYFFLHLPIAVFMLDERNIDIKKIKALLLDLRIALEKMIISRGRLRLIRRKDIYVDLRNPLISLGVPSNFEDYIPGFEYIPGLRPVIISASHATPPSADRFTGDLAKIISRKTDSHALIATIPRIYIDPNRIIGRISPYRRFIDELVKTKKIRLIVDLHAMRNKSEYLVAIGTWYGLSISSKLLDRLLMIFDEYNISYELSTHFVGGDITFYHSKRPLVNAVQLEISNNLTKREFRLITKSLIKFVSSIGGKNKSRRSSR